MAHRLNAWFLAALALSSISSLSHTVRAQGTDEFGPYGGQETVGTEESRQDFGLEVRFGPYLPRVDSEFSGATPFADVFGDSNRFMMGLEFDWQAIRIPKILSFGPGVGVSYTSMGARAPLSSGEGRADQETTLKIMPNWAVGVLRLDVLARQTVVPLVFDAKFGLGGGLWWSRDGNDPARAEDGTRGKGTSYGIMYAFGLLVDLAFLEPTRARRLDSLSGVNHTYLKGELYALDLDGFGSDAVMNIGDRTWIIALAFEF